MNYFDKLPTITYNGHVVKNIMARARLSDQTRKNKSIYYPYTMSSEDRIDTLSNQYYNDPGYTWLIWMTNEVIDPYFDLPLSEDDLLTYITNTYGSLALAQRKISYFRPNWAGNEERKTVAQFESLAAGIKKYYSPVVDNHGALSYYERNPDNARIRCNKVINIDIGSVSGTFVRGEEVQVNGTNYAFVTHVDSTSLTCKNVFGAFNASDIITGIESGATATVVDSTVIYQAISDAEVTYWEPVSYFDAAVEYNEAKKEIKLMDVRYSAQAAQELQRVMGT